MVSFHNLVVRVLQRYGFEVSARDGLIEGTKDGATVTVGVFQGAAKEDVGRFIEAVRERDGGKIAAFLDDVTQETRERLEKRSITVWDKAAIEEELGRAIVSHVDGSEGSIFEALSSPDINAAAEPANGGAKLPLLVESGGAEREMIMRPILGAEHAKEIGDKTISGFRQHMELVPFFFYEYLCVVRIKGVESMDKRAGTIGVNGLTGEASAWGAIGDVVTDVQDAHVRLEPKIDAQGAERAALVRAAELNTENVELLTEKEHSTVVERVVVRPDRGDITLSPKGLVFVPMWCIEGLRGVMILNAATGKVVSEEFYSEERPKKA
ncbi:MAG: hypothetical protein HZB92_04350 [Euryarchaeota archaeon]|nr:hypothetical protein [Euryarchaeota archaeon]